MISWDIDPRGFMSFCFCGIAANILYNPDIPTPRPDVPTDIETIHTIDADGTHHYFDLLGRQLLHKPEQGVYIDNNKKVLAK